MSQTLDGYLGERFVQLCKRGARALHERARG